MAANPDSKQRRRRWNDSVLEAPQGYRQQLASLQGALNGGSSTPPAGEAAAVQQLLSKLDAFSSRPYHHGDMDPVKAITAAAEQCGAACPADSQAWQHGMQALLELLFMHNSRPLHKQLLSCVRKLSPAHQHVVGQLVLGLAMREAAGVLLAGSPGQQAPQQWELLQVAAPPSRQQEQEQQQQVPGCFPKAVTAVVLSAPARLPAAAVERGFDLAQAVLSVVQVPAARSWLQLAAPLLLLATARSIHTTLDPQLPPQQAQQHEQEQQARQPQPQQQHLTSKVIELVQDAINVTYQLLQHYGQHMTAPAAGAAGSPAAAATGAPDPLAVAGTVEAAQSMLCALQGSLVVREALASAAVVVWAAAVLPAVPPTSAALVFAAGLLPGQLPPGVAAAAAAAGTAGGIAGADGGSSSAGMRAQQLLQEWRRSSLLEQQLALQGTSLVQQLQQAPAVARVCALKGLLAAMPPAALAGDLGLQQQQQDGTLSSTNGLQLPLEQLTLAPIAAGQAGGQHSSSGSQSSFLMGCALPFVLKAARTAPDAHLKFYTMSLLASVLEGAEQLWGALQEHNMQAAATANHDGAAAAAGATGAVAASTSSSSGVGDAAGGAVDTALVVPWLSVADAQSIMDLLSSHLDEPVAQVLAKVQEAFVALLALVRSQQKVAEGLGLQLAAPAAADSSGAAGAPSSGVGAAQAAALAGADAAAGQPLLQPAEFLMATAQCVLAIAPSRKGRYSPLTALLPHLGASVLLQLQPSLVADTIQAMQSNLCASAAAVFFKALLLQLRAELTTPALPSQQQQQQQQAGAAPGSSSSTTAVAKEQFVPAAMRAWCSYWMPELLSALWAQGERARTYVANYAVPMVLQAEPHLLQPLVDTILAAHAADVQAASTGTSTAGSGAAAAGVRDAEAALVVVLRTGRRLQLVGDLDVLLPQPQPPGTAGEGSGVEASSSMSGSPAGLLLSAVSSATASLRIEALELVCISARTTAPPGVLELLVAQRWLTLCLRCTGADSRHKSLALWEKLLARQAAAVRAIRHRAAVANTPGASGGAHPKGLPRAARSLLSAQAGPGAAAVSPESEAEAEQRQLRFLSWLSQALLDSLYPGGPYERKYFALELMAVLLQHWLHTDYSTSTAGKPVPRGQHKPGGAPGVTGSAVDAAALSEPFLAGLLSPGCVQTLLCCVVDSWEKMRRQLPGCETPEQLLPLLTWAVQLMQSPRMSESDAGARTVQLLASKYLLGLGWTLCLAPEPTVTAPSTQQDTGSSGSVSTGSRGAAGIAEQQDRVQAIAALLGSLSSLLRQQLAGAQADITAASRHGLVHGMLLCLKYCVQVLPWPALASSSCTASLAVSAPSAAACGLANGSTSASASGSAPGALVAVAGPAPVVLHCWVTDLVDLLDQVAALVKPLLSAQTLNVAANEVEEAEDDDTFSDTDLDEAPTSSSPEGAAPAAAAVPAGAAADAAAAGQLSGPAIQLLISACWTTWKETSLLIGALAGRLPLPKSSPTAGSSAAPTAGSQQQQQQQQQQLIECCQLEQLGSLQLGMLLSMKHNGAVEKSQAGFIALLERLLHSPEPCLNQLPREWLDRCLARVQEPGQGRDDIVRRSAGLPFAICALFLAELGGAPKQLLPYGLQRLLDIASDEGLQEPWPRVHAFNTLRVVFNDSNMAMDSSGFHATGVVAAIRGMTAPAWEVRNAAALTFTALLLRVVGARNIDARQQKLLKPLNQLAATPPGLHTYDSSSSSRGGSLLPAIQGPSAVDFFNRYPQLHAFLLQQLQEAVQQQRARAGGSNAATVPPSLFPALILLSRLRPLLLSTTGAAQDGNAAAGAGAATDDAAEAAAAGGTAGAVGLDPAVFVPAVVAVGQSAVLGVRSMAAAALAPLVPVEQLHAVCLQLASLLPAAAAAAHEQSVPGINGSSQQPVCQNALHGTLLQLTALLAAASNSCSQQTGNAGSSAAAVALVQQLLPAFVQGSALLNPASGNGAGMCCAVKQQYIAAGGQLLVLAYKQWPLLHTQQEAATGVSSGGGSGGGSTVELLQQLVHALQSHCLLAVGSTVPAAGAAAAGSTSGLESQDPLYSCWLRDCAALLLGPLLELQVLLDKHALPVSVNADAALVSHQLQLLAALLPTALQSSCYEVTAAALKAAGVQLTRLLAVARQLLATGVDPFTAAGSDAIRAAQHHLQALAGSVWLALQQEQQLVKLTKRLLVVWGLLQELQGVHQHQHQHQSTSQQQQQQQQQQQESPAAGAAEEAGQGCSQSRGGPGTAEQQLLVLLGILDSCREPEASAQALLCAARAARRAVLQPACTAAGSTAASVGASREKTAVGSADSVQLLDKLCLLAGQAGLPDRPEQLRAAAAEALQLSGLLLPLAQGAAASSAPADATAQQPLLSPDGQVNGAAAAQMEVSVSGDNVAGLGGAAAAVGTAQQPQPAASLAGLSLRAWFLALRLMEDEEEDVRQAAAAAAQQALRLVPQAVLRPLLGEGSASSGGATLALSTEAAKSALGAGGGGAASGAQYVAAVQSSCFALVARCCSCLPQLRPELVRLLLKVVLPVQTAVPQVLHRRQQQQQQHGSPPEPCDAGVAAAAAAAAAAGGQAGLQLRLPGVSLRRLFEREADNHHEEPLLLAQHAAVALQHALATQQGPLLPADPGHMGAGAGLVAPRPTTPTATGTPPVAELDAELQRWCSWALQQFLPPLVGGLAAAGSGPASSGCDAQAADAHHPEVFVPLYRCCLGLWAVGPWLRAHSSGSVRAALAADAETQLARLSGTGRLPQGLAEVVQAARDGRQCSAAATFLLQ